MHCKSCQLIVISKTWALTSPTYTNHSIHGCVRIELFNLSEVHWIDLTMLCVQVHLSALTVCTAGLCEHKHVGNCYDVLPTTASTPYLLCWANTTTINTPHLIASTLLSPGTFWPTDKINNKQSIKCFHKTYQLTPCCPFQQWVVGAVCLSRKTRPQLQFNSGQPMRTLSFHHQPIPCVMCKPTIRQI